MILKEIRKETVFGTIVFQNERSNCRRGLLKSQRNPKGASILHKD